MLGDMLMELNQPEAALAAYQAALKESPNGYNALQGVQLAEKSSVREAAGRRSLRATLLKRPGEAPNKAVTEETGLNSAFKVLQDSCQRSHFFLIRYEASVFLVYRRAHRDIPLKTHQTWHPRLRGSMNFAYLGLPDHFGRILGVNSAAGHDLDSFT